jgi:uncharacterized membrane protein YcjF (UPF0283 family)
MTAAEYHQQQLEQQEEEELEYQSETIKKNREFQFKEAMSIKDEMSENHAKMIACAHTIRDSKNDHQFVRIAIKYLLEALDEYETLTRRVK